MAIHHSGQFDYEKDSDFLIYTGGTVNFADKIDPDFLSMHEIIKMAKEVGAPHVTGCWYI